ncbi:progesterone receptor-like [Sus scrofa]|uniref:progesterone receptor-like n=1 Tax=Sus scrofa TaxID=9823 RepID=UPI000A2B6159|nr:progesterone receptor-like [Sus scrofa]
MVPLSGRQAQRRRQRRGRAPARKFRGLRGAAPSPPLLHAPDAEACGWLAAPRHSGAPGLAEPGLRIERGGGRRRAAAAAAAAAAAWARRALLGGAGHPAAGAQALGSAARVLDLPRAAGHPGSCSRERGGCMRLSRAPAKGEGAARPRRPGCPRAPRPARAPVAFALRSRGAGAARADGARRKFAEEPPAAAAGEVPVRSRLPGRGALLLRVVPPRRGHADTLAHTGWHRHNPPAGVTGALLPAAKTCPR